MATKGWTILAAMLVVSACISLLPPDPPAISEGVDRIAIQEREHGYNNFETSIISTADSLTNFINALANSDGWNNWPAFRDSLLHTQLDFTEERIVLLRHTETSGSIKVSVGTPYAAQGEVVVPISREVPAVGTTDMAYYCYGFRVNKEITQLRFIIEGMDDVVCTFAVAVH